MSTDVRDHITGTYLSLRLGMALIAIFFPIVLWLGGVAEGQPLQDSMSAYYFSGGGAMRDVFVGVLFAIGAFLYVYKGFNDLENIALNLAGVFVIGVAIFPTEWNCGSACQKITLHGTCAVLFFLCIAYVAIFRAPDTLSLIKSDEKIRHYKLMYRLLGWGMVASPAIALVLTYVLQPGTVDRSTIFFVEAVAVLMFAAYWLTKSREIMETNAEVLALAGKIAPSAPARAADLLEPLPIHLVGSAPIPSEVQNDRRRLAMRRRNPS